MGRLLASQKMNNLGGACWPSGVALRLFLRLGLHSVRCVGCLSVVEVVRPDEGVKPNQRSESFKQPPATGLAAQRGMGSDWRDQISSIIADTNRNLGGRGLTTIAAVPPLAYCSARRPAEFESVFRGGPSATAGAFSGGGGGGGGYSGFSLPESPKAAAAAAAHQAHQAAAQQSPLDALMSDGQQAYLTSQVGNFQGSLQRILESVKFELDVRGSIAQKHMEVRPT